MEIFHLSAQKRVAPIRARLALAALLIIGAPLAASAATVCVNPAGTGGCFKTIGAGVANAGLNGTVEVAKGTYPEDVKILTGVSIVGANQKNTIIDATGLANGFFIDGIDVPGLSNVLVSGFTVKNANFEGILVANASSVTISDNIVSGNDKALTAPDTESAACTGIPAFETGESDDCGEGIHLLGANHSIVSNNLVENNAGGILLSDDTGAATHNLISGNTVQKNSFDCGITMASHTAAALTGSDTPLGVTQNTVIENISTQNGLGAPFSGAGVGIFVGAPSGIASGNAVINNTITKNSLPGVTMHSHAPGETFTNNVIIGNNISGNAGDNGQTATTGTTGINVFGLSPATGTIISGNTINDEEVDVVINTPAEVDVHFNNLLGKNTFGVQTPNGTADATLNFWGCPKGPPTKGCSQVVPSSGVTVFPVSSKKF
jgi:parallel beta-helix repeat protein